MTYQGNIPEDFNHRHYINGEEQIWNMGDKSLESDINDFKETSETLKLRKQYTK